MELKIRKTEDIMIVDVSGELDTNTAPDAEAFLLEKCSDTSKIVLNLKSLEYSSSAGLRVFLATAKRLKAGGGIMKICNLNETLKEIFDVSGFTFILSVYDTEVDALSDFTSGS